MQLFWKLHDISHPSQLLWLLSLFIHSVILCSWADSLHTLACDSEWVTVSFIAHIINIHRSCVLVALCGCCMAGATWNVAVSVQVLNIPFNHAPNRLQCHFIQSHIGRVYECSAVTCHLHFWQNDQDLLSATAVTQGGTDTEIKVSKESWPWRRKFSCHSCQDSNPGPFDHESNTNHWAIPAPQSYFDLDFENCRRPDLNWV